MKKTLLHVCMLLPMAAIAQIPVTDAATNASIGIVNNQLLNMNIQLKAVNKNLGRLITLMEKNNNDTSKSRKILKEELEAKKEAPAYVTGSTDVAMTIELKSKILEAYRSSKSTIQKLEYLDRKETREFLGFAAAAILDTKDLFKQCGDILNTKAIILPEERLKKVDGINNRLEKILDGLIAYNNKLSRTNAFRTVSYTHL